MTIEIKHVRHDKTDDAGRIDRVDTIVMHYDGATTIAGSLQYMMESVDKDPDTSASYHYLVGDGRIIEMVDPLTATAWHAGKSQHSDPNGLSVNRRSIGIAIRNHGWAVTKDNVVAKGPRVASVGGRYWEPYYERDISALVNELLPHIKGLGFNIRHCVGHSEIAPGRKVDPGPLFPWPRVHQSLGILFP